jgi:sec-independent protein translocase protein TatB
MFDIGASELLVIGVVALLVVGPKELPGLIRSVGQATNKLRRMAGEFRGQFDEAMREAELHEAQKTVQDIRSSIAAPMGALNPLDTLRRELSSIKDDMQAGLNTTPTPASAQHTGAESIVVNPTSVSEPLVDPFPVDTPARTASALPEGGTPAPAPTDAELQALIEEDRFKPKTERRRAPAAAPVPEGPTA